jgi:hypothetical protein
MVEKQDAGKDESIRDDAVARVEESVRLSARELYEVAVAERRAAVETAKAGLLAARANLCFHLG